MSEKNLDKLNAQLEDLGLETVKDVDKTPERTRYLQHIQNPDWGDKDWVKKLNFLKKEYADAFYKFFVEKYSNFLYERNDDKTYWDYDETTGIYDELTAVSARGLVISLAIDEGLEETAKEGFAKETLAKFRARNLSKAVTYDDFDSHTDWFHAKNGWVNVDTLEFKEHSPKRLSRRVSAVEYDKKAKCPIYDTFLDEDIKIAKDAIRVIDQFSGLLLIPEIKYQKMLTLIGRPASGKSTLLNAWNHVLGDLATQKKLTEVAGDSARFIGSSLVGKNLCWFDEVDIKRSEMSSSLINMISAEHISIERKGINGIVEAENSLKCVLTANRLPLSSEDGMFRRLIFINFERSFEEENIINTNILDHLKEESSGILNRMLKGLQDLRKAGHFTVIAGHEEMIEEYKQASDPLAGFLSEYFVPKEDEEVSAHQLFLAYKLYREGDSFVRSLTPQKFGMLLKSQNLAAFSKIKAKRYNDGKRWVGLMLKGEYEFNEIGMIKTADEVRKEKNW